MDKKSIMSRKTLKIILGICIVAVIAAVAGLFGYTYMADHNTLGRKISVNGLDVSRLNAQEAEDKIIASFENRPVSFQEDDQEIYRTTLNKERKASTDAEIRYDQGKKEFILVKQKQGTEIDEDKLQTMVETTLNAAFDTANLVDVITVP